MTNELPDIEVLGEWDHGVCDPVFDNTSTDNTEESEGTTEDSPALNDLSCSRIVGSIVNAEHAVEGAFKSAVLGMERRFEAAVGRAPTEEEMRSKKEKSSD